MATAWDLVCELAEEYGMTLTENCLVFGLTMELSIVRSVSNRVSVKLTLHENGPILTLETTNDGETWMVARTWGGMTPFDSSASWQEIVPENEGDFPSECLFLFPTEEEHALLKDVQEGVIDTARAISLLRTWFKAFIHNDRIMENMLREFRRGLLKQPISA